MAMNNHSIISLLLMFITLFGAAVAIRATTSNTPSAKAYWDLKFPNVAMPTLLQSMLPNPSGFDYKEAKASFARSAATGFRDCVKYEMKTTEALRKNTIYISMFIQEEDLHKPGTIHELQYLGQSNMGPPFMTRNEVQTRLPFNSQNLSRVLAAFSIDPSSKEAEIMKYTLNGCEKPLKGSHRVCVSSLEDMVDFVASEFQPSIPSKDLQVFGTTVTPEMEVLRRYRIKNVKKVGEGKNAMSCHKSDFPYGTFMCHHLGGAVAHVVQLESVDDDNFKVSTLMSCHRDTAEWSPKYGGFEILGRKPGQTVCHFLLGNSIYFINNK